MAIDTNVLVGLLDDNDKWHTFSVALRDALYEAGAGLIYFDCVVNETVNVRFVQPVAKMVNWAQKHKF